MDSNMAMETKQKIENSVKLIQNGLRLANFEGTKKHQAMF